MSKDFKHPHLKMPEGGNGAYCPTGFESKKLTEQELGELRVMHDIIKREQYKYGLVKGNTAVITMSKERTDKEKKELAKFMPQWLEVQEGLIKVLSVAREDFINALCTSKEITGKISIDLETGVITKRDE